MEWAAAKLFLKACWAFLKRIPWQLYAALLVLLMLWGLYATGVHAGRAEVQAKVDAAKAAQVLAEARLREAQGKVTERVVTKYVDRVKVVQGRTQTIVKEVPIYVPADAPALPGGFRLLHDAAAAGVLPDPAGLADAAPVSAQSVAETVASNYGTCHETEAQLTALQDWVREQQKIH